MVGHAELNRLLRIFDVFGTGTLRRSELVEVLKRTNGSLFTDANVTRLLDGFDQDRHASVCIEQFLLWLTQDYEKGPRKRRDPRRHLVLHFDINKTIVMVDSVTGKTVADIANAVLATTSWGTAEERGGAIGKVWRCVVAAPRVRRPAPDLVSYAEFLEAQLPGPENKERREVLLHRFTAPSEPGEAMRRHCDAFLATLKLPEAVAGTEAARAAGLQRGEVFIIPAFFQLLLHLKLTSRSFCLVFRTFGEDLEEVAREFNAFCEGRHPLFPEAVLDGRDGDVDYRIAMHEPSAFGTFFRSTVSCDGDALIFGTLRQPKLKDGLDFYQECSASPGVKVVSGGLEAICGALHSRTRRPGTLALRDYFPFWRQQGMGSDPKKLTGGKLMVVDPCAPDSSHEMFFDDNISYTAPRIVDVRHARLPQKVLSAQYLLSCHVVRAEPLEAVTDHQYFIKHVDRLTAAYEQRLMVCARLRRLLWKAASTSAFARARALPLSLYAEQYDAWAGMREDKRCHSTAEIFEEVHPDVQDRAAGA